MTKPVIGFEDERMIQRTIGLVNWCGIQYEIDWRYHEENNQIVACEPSAWVFLNGEQIIDFVNPREGVTGWTTKEEVLYDAGRFIKNGHMHQLLNDRGML